MERVQEIFRQRQSLSYERFLDFTPLNRAQKSYLTEVYAVLGGTVLLSTIGVQIYRYVYPIPFLLCAILQFFCATYIFSTQGTYQSYKDSQCLKRIGALASLSMLSGCSLAPLIDYANFLNPNILSSALLATAVSFVCFSLGAIFAKERKYLYLGSILTSALSYLSLVSIFNLFFASPLAQDVVLYAGLFVYLGFIVYDTQSILHEHSCGTRDPILHAFTFYVDIIGLFIRLMHLLTQREQKRMEEKKRT